MATYLMADLHGDLIRFRKMLKTIEYTSGADTMIILGDVLDRGKDHLKLLNFIRKDASMEVLKGNHELFAQMYLEGRLEAGLWKKWGGERTLSEIERLTEVKKAELLACLKGLKHYRILRTAYGDTLLTHAGFYLDACVERADGSIDVLKSLQKGIEKDEFQCLISNDIHHVAAGVRRRFDRYIICGHVPTMGLNEDRSNRIFHATKYMCIDTGAGHREAGGVLSCYRVEDEEEFYL